MERKGRPLAPKSAGKKIWVEPISPGAELRKELLGWYQVIDLFVQTKYGNRFYLDTYASKWLAFLSENE